MPLAITDRTILMSGAGLVGATQAGLSSRLSAADARTLLGLSTSDSPTFAGLTLSGHLLFSPTNTKDVGDGVYDPRTVRAATSVIVGAATLTASGVTYSPGLFSSTAQLSIGTTNAGLYVGSSGIDVCTTLAMSAFGSVRAATFNNPSAATIIGNSTYGVTVPGAMGVGGANTGGKQLEVNGTGDIYLRGITPTVQFYTAGSSQSYTTWYSDKFRIGTWDGAAWRESFIIEKSAPTNSLVISSTGAATFSGSITGYSTNPYLLLESTTNGPPYVKLKNTAAERRWIMDSGGGIGLENSAVGTNLQYIRAGGSVGIGNFYAGLEPTAKFQVDSGIAIGYGPGTTPTVPANGIVAGGDISMSKTSAQGYIRAYYTDGVANASLSQTATGTRLEASSGWIDLRTANGIVYAYSTAADSQFRVYEQVGNFYTQLTTNNLGNGTLSTTQAKLILAPNTYLDLSPANGITQVYKAGSQSYFRVYNGAATRYLEFTQNSVNNEINTSAGILILAPAEGSVYVAKSGYNSALDVYDSGFTKYSRLTHDGTNGILSTSSGNLNLVPTGGTVAVTGAVTIGAAPVTSANLNVAVNGSGFGWAVSSSGTEYVECVVGGVVKGIRSYGAVPFTIETSIGYSILLNSGNFIYNFGASTSARPAIKVSSTTFAVRLGDDSADAPISCAGITASGAVLQTAEVTNTPSGTTQTITLTSGNYQTLTLASSTGDVTVTLTVPATSGGGDILIVQHATTPRDITWAASSGSIVWLGTEPTWNGDATSSYRKVSWRFNGTNTYLTSSGSS